LAAPAPRKNEAADGIRGTLSELLLLLLLLLLLALVLGTTDEEAEVMEEAIEALKISF
jgi:hypothetical protein